MNIVKDSESSTACAKNHIHGILNLLLGSSNLIFSPSSSSVESEVEVDERRGKTSWNFSSSRTAWYFDAMIDCKKITPRN